MPYAFAARTALITINFTIKSIIENVNSVSRLHSSSVHKESFIGLSSKTLCENGKSPSAPASSQPLAASGSWASECVTSVAEKLSFLFDFINFKYYCVRQQGAESRNTECLMCKEPPETWWLVHINFFLLFPIYFFLPTITIFQIWRLEVRRGKPTLLKYTAKSDFSRKPEEVSGLQTCLSLTNPKFIDCSAPDPAKL